MKPTRIRAPVSLRSAGKMDSEQADTRATEHVPEEAESLQGVMSH